MCASVLYTITQCSVRGRPEVRAARIFAQIPPPPWRSPDMPITLVTPTAGPTPRRTVDPTAPNSADPSRTRVPPLVIAHRGASETWPENTIPAFMAGIDQGEDMIEPDEHM